MNTILIQYQENSSKSRDLVGLYGSLSQQTTTILDVSDLLRAALVLGVSALDYFIHEITRKGMIETFNGLRTETDAYLRFNISMKMANNLVLDPSNTIWIEDEIRTRHSWLSFQDPDKLADAIRLIHTNPIWSDLSEKLLVDKKILKDRLKLIVERRNKIAHEADMNPTDPGSKWPISPDMVTESIDYLNLLVVNIYDLVKI